MTEGGPAGSAGPGLQGEPQTDILIPFRLERANLRGRAVRLGPAIDAILSRHDYPPPVADLLGEALALAAVLAGTLKYDGIFTLQVKGDGPVGMLVCDVTSDGDLRGYAEVDEAAYAALGAAAPDGPVPRHLGAGHLAFTVDQGPDMERYQGIVDLAGATLTECAQHYFRQSEQVETLLRLGVGRPDGRRWQASALMIQRVPMTGGVGGGALGGGGAPAADDSGHADEDRREDDWRRLAMLLGTVRNAEALAPDVDPLRLLHRLFHADGVRVFEPQALRDRCRCSDDRAENALRMLDADELADMTIDGTVTVACQFCSRVRRYDEAALAALRAGLGAAA
ncbi:MAG: Hsp33 family molecular chaperone HslO [Rhodospirillaceae bacterium]|nr:Hsp33 family molecular chaperone HslO [Rhodospirillaceae bacterium]